MQLNKEELKQARAWLMELDFSDIEPDEINELSDADIANGIKRHFDGGIESFKATCEF